MDDISGPYGPSLANEDPYVLPYDPAAVFLLEIMASIARQTPSHIEDLWCASLLGVSTVPDWWRRPVIFEHLSALLSAAIHYSVLLIERAVVALLRLCLILAQKVR